MPGYKGIENFKDGAYDQHEFVSPWTRSAGNLDADVMILLQDWSSSDVLNGALDHEAASLGYTPSLPTNRNLIELVKRHFGLKIAETYVTNLFVFIKLGGISARIPLRDAVTSASLYAVPQIKIIKPKIAICVGALTFNALRRACGEPVVNLKRAESAAFSIGSVRVCGVPHTGGLGTASMGGLAAVDKFWSAAARELLPR